MAQPVTTVTLGGTDISAYVGSAPGGTSLTYSRGANFDGSNEGPGTAVITVQNSAKTFNPANAGSSLAAVLKIGKEVRCTALYSATTYGLFHGYLRRIIPLEGGFAELHCEDALWKYGRKQTSIVPTVNLSYRQQRDAILDDIGETAGRRSLDDGVEEGMPLTALDNVNALNALEEINKATGSIHWIDPDPADPPGYVYHVRSRNDLQTTVSVGPYTDTDLTVPFPVEMGGYDYTDEGVVNSQRVVAHPYTVNTSTLLWSSPEVWFTLLVGQTKDIWVDLPGRVIGLSVTPTTWGGTPTTTLTAFSSSALISLSAAGSSVTWTGLTLSGQLVVDSTASSTSVDTTSQTAYGILAGSDIDTQLIASTAEGSGLGDWVIYRYKDPQARPTITLQNRFPGQLQREVGDRVTLTASLYSISARQYFIRQITVAISGSGAVWQSTYQLEEAPAVVSAFTIGGTAGQGVGGTGILGY